MIGTRVRVLIGYNLGQKRRTLQSVVGKVVRELPNNFYEVELPDGELRLYAEEGVKSVD